MAHDKWFISDTHFFHENIIQFCKRPFKDAQFMNEFMVNAWNERVKPEDKVYHLGDVACGYGGDEHKLGALLSRLNGKKRLVVGNHDHLKSPALHKYFEKIELWCGFHEEGFTCTHIPLEIESLRDGDICIHGHIHNNLKPGRYVNVCVEHTDYAPISMEELFKRIRKVT